MAILLKIESYNGNSLSDIQHCELHKAILELVNSTIDSGLLNFPKNLYWSYKGYVNIENKLYQKVNSTQKNKHTSLDITSINESFQDARKQTETNFHYLCQWLELTTQSDIPNEEQDKLTNLIDGLNQIILDN